MEVLNVVQVYRVLASMTKPTGPYAKRVQTLCNMLIEVGFHSVRYYEAVHDRFEDEPIHFVLAQAAYRDGAERNVIGLRIPFSKTTLVTSSESSDGLARGQYNSATDEQKRLWIDLLEINKTQWIDLEIKSKGEIVGLLAVSWTGSRDLVDKEGEAALRIIRGTLGNLFTASLGADQPFIEGRRIVLSAIEKWEDDRQQSMMEILRSLQNIISSDQVSVFRYDWIENTVVKVGEHTLDAHKGHESFPESYDLGRMLTGRAFIDDAYRFIPNFAVLEKSEDPSIDLQSLNYHKAKLGALRSVMYLAIGTQANRLLFRFFRTESGGLPSFTQRDYALARIIEDFSTPKFDSIELHRRTEVVREAAIDGLRGFSDPDRLMSLLNSEFSRIGAKSFIFVHYSNSTHSSDFVSATSDIQDPRGVFGTNASTAWETIKAIPTKQKTFDLGLRSLASLNLGPVAKFLRSVGRDSVGVFCLNSSGLATLLLLPLRGAGPSGVQSLSNRLTLDEAKHILSLISILAASLEAKASHISADNADDLLANIGHELQTPITKIEQSAIFAVEASHEILGRVEKSRNLTHEEIQSARDELDRETLFITKKAELLRHFMDIPRIMSEFFGGDSMPITYQQCNWSELVDESWGLAYAWAHEISDYYEELGRASYGPVVLEKNDALRSMACVLAEPLVKMALTNLFKNAIKFSLPRYKNKPMVVEVLAQPQSGWNILQVRNWGIGIERHQFEEIFRKYYRVDRLDARRDIAGRGLGLYLSRAMIKAQGGSLFCESSDWTLDDPDKRRTLQGFLTTFELRIPTSNLPGNRKVRLK